MSPVLSSFFRFTAIFSSGFIAFHWLLFVPRIIISLSLSLSPLPFLCLSFTVWPRGPCFAQIQSSAFFQTCCSISLPFCHTGVHTQYLLLLPFRHSFHSSTLTHTHTQAFAQIHKQNLGQLGKKKNLIKPSIKFDALGWIGCLYGNFKTHTCAHTLYILPPTLFSLSFEAIHHSFSHCAQLQPKTNHTQVRD